ncbi:MAG: 2-oxo acid dehydrogenase subunit E2 [Actinobacteria bacterium]|nr:2-oxo acid dehydrogenase subunit E2 [Actinomycetota bacterium]
MHEVIMPKLGLTMESGKIEKWHKKEGDKVKAGEVLFEVMTDKVTIEVESYDSGILRKILKVEGEEVPVTEVVAYIGEEDEEIPQAEPELAAEDKKKVEVKKAEEAADKVKEVSGISGEGAKISPLARKTAKEIGIDYKSERIAGSGPGGRIVKEDIIAYSKKKGKARKEEAAPVTTTGITIKSSGPLEGIRKVIAERMSYSRSNIPHIVLNAKADVTQLIALRKKFKVKILEKYGVRITYTDFILKSTAVALQENLEVNSTFSDGNYIIYDDVNIGVAVSLEGGLIVPIIFNCDRLEITDIAKKRIELVGKAREGRLSLEEISNGTFTVTDLGMYRIRSFSPIINPPQAAILAVGEIYTEPAVVKGKIEPKSFMDLSVSCDHRIIDGIVGAKFLRRIAELIKNPAELVN